MARLCSACGVGGAAPRRGDLCFVCWQAVRPPSVDGTTILRLRETLKVSVEDAAAAVGLDPLHFVDDVEDCLELDVTYAAEITAKLEALAANRQEPEDQPTPQPKPAPAGSLAAESL